MGGEGSVRAQSPFPSVRAIDHPIPPSNLAPNRAAPPRPEAATMLQVRGYEAGQLGQAFSYVDGSVEIKLPLAQVGQPIAVALFIDTAAGTVVSDIGTNLTAGAAAGVGLRYGPLKFDLAWNAKGARKLHVGLA